MKTAKTVLAIALAFSTTIPGFGNSRSEQDRRVRLQALRASPAARVQQTLLEAAYFDAAGILERQDRCSDFFGGSESRQVLDELVVRLHERSINNSRIGLRMSGSFKIYVSSESAICYRLFEQVELNTAGPFYKSKTFPAEPFVPNVGSFRPNTREARVLILLHELAHMVKGSDNTWLIPDDGGNPQLSCQNTATIESRCGQSIRAL